MKVYLDFETRSFCDLKNSGAYKYSVDPTTEVLCMCWKIENDPAIHVWNPDNLLSFPEDIEIHAHNAIFEYLIWNNVCVPKYNFKPLSLEYFHCSAARGAYYGLPRSLDDICNMTGVAKKDQSGKRLIQKFSKPNKKNIFEKINEDDLKQIIEYCINDVLCEEALDKYLPPLPESERKNWLLNEEINLRGIKIDLQHVDYSLKYLIEEESKLLNGLYEITKGKINSPRQVAVMLKYLKDRNIVMDGLSKSDVVAELLRPDLPEDIRRILEIRQCLSKSSVSKLDTMKLWAHNGRVRGSILYYGAITGRFSGRGIQPHNFPRGKQDDEFFKKGKTNNIFQTVSNNLRGYLIADEGKTFFVGDYAAIEARVLFWAANHIKGVQMFEDGVDLYIDMASIVYNIPKKEITKKSHERALGKAIILGCGYSMSADKFFNTCAGQGLNITKDLAISAVNTYRNIHSPIPNFWYACEKAAKEAIKNPGSVISVNDKICFSKRRDWLFCKLPCGRYISYYKPRIIMGETKTGPKEQINYLNRFGMEKTYGGKLVENIVQAISRDILIESMFNLKQKGFDIVLHVHDEIVCEVKDKDLDEFESVMKIRPPWAKDCPIDVEVFKSNRYRK